MAENARMLRIDEFTEESGTVDDAKWEWLQSPKSHHSLRISEPLTSDLVALQAADTSNTAMNDHDQDQGSTSVAAICWNIHNITGTVQTSENDTSKADANNTTLPPAPSVEVPRLYSMLIDGKIPTRYSITLKKLENLPILNDVIIRAKKTFKTDIKKIFREEAWVGTERGTIAEVFCRECAQGKNPFTICCVIEGMYSNFPTLKPPESFCKFSKKLWDILPS